MSTTYAMYGLKDDATQDYIQTTDTPPSDADIARWHDEYPFVIVSQDTLDDDGHWNSVTRVYDAETWTEQEG